MIKISKFFQTINFYALKSLSIVIVNNLLSERNKTILLSGLSEMLLLLLDFFKLLQE